MQDATVFKFTMQHAAGDAVGMYTLAIPAKLSVSITATPGLYKAAAAFCEGLSSDIHKRPTNLVREYMLAGDRNVGSRWKSVRSLLQTQQARDWFDICTSSKLFSMKTLARIWQNARQNATKWQTIHFSREIIDLWQGIARETGVKVSKFNLLASWIHLVRDSSIFLD